MGYEMIKQHFFVCYVFHFCNYTTHAYSDTLSPVSLSSKYLLTLSVWHFSYLTVWMGVVTQCRIWPQFVT